MCVFVCISTQCTHFHSKISTNARRLNALATRNKDNTLKHLLWFEYYAFFTNWSVIHRKATPIHTQLHAMQFLLQKSNTIESDISLVPPSISYTGNTLLFYRFSRQTKNCVQKCFTLAQRSRLHYSGNLVWQIVLL